MNRIILIFLISCTGCMGWLTGKAQQGQTDKTVFGFTLGAPFTVPECPCRLVEKFSPNSSGLIRHKIRGYDYASLFPTSGYCFQRKNISNYTIKKQGDSLPPVTNEIVTVAFNLNESPAMLSTARFDAVVSNGNLIAIMFEVRTDEAGKDFTILKNKYGTNVSVQNFKAQNGYGATIPYYEAVWTLPDLQVAMTSSLHRSFSDAFGQVTIGLPVAVHKQEDKRPL